MRLLVVLSLIAVTMIATSTATASPLHKRYVTRAQRIALLKRKIHHNKCIIKFWHHHRTLAGTHKELSHWQLHQATKHLKRLESKLHKLVTSMWPPHHLLWLCIHHVEGAWNNHGPGHYGGLQMHWNWGYGIVGDAGNYTQAQQEWAAERGYRASGFSDRFLYDQWFNWDEATYCLQYR